MRLIDGEDVRASLEIVRDWSKDNAASDLDWRRIHAAANILALRLFEGAQQLATFKSAVSVGKQRVEQAEALAQLTSLGLLLAGKAVLPNGERLTEKVSYSVAKDLSRRFVANDEGVKEAQAQLLSAEADLTAFDQKMEAFREISQGAKSTARLMQEIG